VPGGMTLTWGVSGSSLDVWFSGEETLTIQAVSATRGTRDFTLRYPAASFRASFEEDTTLTFDPAGPVRLFEFTGRDRQGDTYVLETRVSALPQTVTIDITRATLESGEAQTAISELLETMLENGLGPGGTAEGKAIAFEPPLVRWYDPGSGLGTIDVSIHFAPGDGPERPYINDIHTVDFDVFGFDSSSRIPAYFAFPDPLAVTYATEYLRRVLENAFHDHPESADLEDSYFSTPVLSSGGPDPVTVSITINLSIDDGNGGVANITPVSHTGADPLRLAEAGPLLGGDTSYNDHDTLRDTDEFVDDAYTAMIDAILAGGPGSESERVDLANEFFQGYTTLVFSYVDLPPYNQPGAWNVTAPDVAGLRGFATSSNANDLKERDKQVDPFTNGGVIMILATNKAEGETTADGSAETLAHELGHKTGFPDLYYQQGFKDDAAYMSGLDIMAGAGGAWPHFTSYHKLVKGWIAPEEINLVNPPSAGNPVTRQVLLVPLERWNPSLEGQVRNAFPGAPDDIPVRAAMIAQLAGDGGQFVTIEARWQGAEFSQSIDPPRIVIANALDYLDDTRYVDEVDPELGELSEGFLKPFRRKIHLLDQSLRDIGDTFNVAQAPEFPVVGMHVSVVDRQDVDGIPVFQVRLDWEQGDWIDLGFTDTLPAWRTPDIGLDWLGDGQHNWDIGEPLEQGEKLMVPPAGTDPEPHQVFVRLWNFGTAPARDVTVNLHVYDPGGGGDADEENFFASQTLEEVQPSGDDNPAVLRFDWSVPPGQNPHICFRAVVADSDVPVDPDTGVALASADTTSSNDWGQQNVFEFEAIADSPPAPVDLLFRIYNDGPFRERVSLIPRGLPDGAKVTVSPRSLIVPSKATRYFRVKVELEEWLLHVSCGKDVDFLLEAWRRDGDSEVRWGATKYRIKPRLATALTLQGYWVYDAIKLYGAISPDIGPGNIRLRVRFEGENAFWMERPLEGAGTFELELDGAQTQATSLSAYARFEGTADWSSSSSPAVQLTRHVEG
jgi:M6 family metalloprotease-like protein